MKDYFDIANTLVDVSMTLGALEKYTPPAKEGTPSRKPATTEVLELDKRFNKLALGCQALWELLRERLNLTEEELRAKVLEIDLRDGRTDGNMSISVMECPACKARTNSRRQTCLMCGAPLEKPHAFEV